jgi:2,4-dienoyl-CoA reductase-like NADH-dependent reductase (Old Yellow Enzyme family)
MSSSLALAPQLFQPLTIRSLTLKNRVVISPMMQHRRTGQPATPWHLVHLGKFALGGAGLIFVESTGRRPRRVASARQTSVSGPTSISNR